MKASKLWADFRKLLNAHERGLFRAIWLDLRRQGLTVDESAYQAYLALDGVPFTGEEK